MKSLFILLFLAGCASVFDTEAQALRGLEAQARLNQQYDRPERTPVYRFVLDPDSVCRAEGVAVRTDSRVEACALINQEPCVIILPYAPLKAWVIEEQLHCRYGNFHPEKK